MLVEYRACCFSKIQTTENLVYRCYCYGFLKVILIKTRILLHRFFSLRSLFCTRRLCFSMVIKCILWLELKCIQGSPWKWKQAHCSLYCDIYHWWRSHGCRLHKTREGLPSLNGVLPFHSPATSYCKQLLGNKKTFSISKGHCWLSKYFAHFI